METARKIDRHALVSAHLGASGFPSIVIVLSLSLAGSPRLLLVVCLCGFFASPAWCVFNQHGKIRFSISCCSLGLVFNQEGSVVVPFTCFVIYRLVISPVGRMDIKVLFSVSSAALLSIVCLHPPISHRSIVSGHDSLTAQTSPVPTPQIDRPE